MEEIVLLCMVMFGLLFGLVIYLFIEIVLLREKIEELEKRIERRSIVLSGV